MRSSTEREREREREELCVCFEREGEDCVGLGGMCLMDRNLTTVNMFALLYSTVVNSFSYSCLKFFSHLLKFWDRQTVSHLHTFLLPFLFLTWSVKFILVFSIGWWFLVGLEYFDHVRKLWNYTMKFRWCPPEKLCPATASSSFFFFFPTK